MTSAISFVDSLMTCILETKLHHLDLYIKTEGYSTYMRLNDSKTLTSKHNILLCCDCQRFHLPGKTIGP